jgi:threonine aldolase
MLSFESDYTEGAHPQILQRLQETNMVQTPGYGTDEFCASAAEKIRSACGCPDAYVFFLTGGTQTNQIVIDSLLKPYEGVVSAETGHINAHEAGAVEFTGHKVLALPHHCGKMDPQELDEYLNRFFSDGNHEHMVFPGMVYLSFPTEYGTLYTRKELETIHEVCHRYDIPLYLDGARLAYGLAAEGCDLTLPDIAALTDVFYIGGTKVGALCGEAIVFPRDNAPKHFLTQIKQRGALLAKGRLNGIQFDTLFSDGLYFDLGRHAVEMARRLRTVLHEAGCTFFLESPTNQQFIILEDSLMERLSHEVAFDFWEKHDATHTVVRFATSWATRPEDIDALAAILQRL